MNQLTVILLNYNRPQNTPRIVAALRSQSIAIEIFLWNNSGAKLGNLDVDWLVDSSVNRFCWPRWFIATYARTEHVAVLDDDVCPRHPRAMEAMLECSQAVGEGSLIGLEGVILRGNAPYFPTYTGRVTRHVEYASLETSTHIGAPLKDTRVDIVKGRCVVAHTASLRKLPLCPIDRDACDDIVISAMVGGGLRRPHLVPAGKAQLFANLADQNGPMALSSRHNWREIRERARRKFFPHVSEK